MDDSLFIVYVDSRRFTRENLRLLVSAEDTHEALLLVDQYLRDSGKTDHYHSPSKPEKIKIRYHLVRNV